MDDVFGTAAIFLLSILMGVIYWTLHVIHKELAKSNKRIEADLAELKKYHESAPMEISKLPRTIASINFPKEKEVKKKESSKTYSAEHKAKLSAARKAFWERKKAAEQAKPAQLPVSVETPAAS